MVSQVPALRQCEGLDTGVGFVLSRLPAHIKTTASGKSDVWYLRHVTVNWQSTVKLLLMIKKK